MSTPLTLLTLNTANYDDHPGWLDRLGFIVNSIFTSEANVICLSEIRYTETNAFNTYAAQYWINQQVTYPNLVPPANPASMADQIKALIEARTGVPWNMVTDIAANYIPGAQWEGLSVLSTLPMSNHGTFNMQSTYPNCRITQYVDVATESGNTVTVYNTHFDTNVSTAGTDAQEVVSFITNEQNGPFALVGDMNSTPTDPAIPILQQAGYIDIWQQTYPNDPGYTFASPQPDSRIDYIWASSALAANATAIALAPPNSIGFPTYTNSDEGTIFVSDHIGLCATFNI